MTLPNILFFTNTTIQDNIKEMNSWLLKIFVVLLASEDTAEFLQIRRKRSEK